MNRTSTLLFITLFFYPSILYANNIEDRLSIIENQIEEQGKIIKNIYKLLGDKSSTPTSTSTVAAQPPQERYEYLQSIPPAGKRFRAWYAHIFALDEGFDLSGKRIPLSRIGSFIAEHSSEYDIKDVNKYLKNDFSGKSLWQGVGYLQVSEPGGYTFSLNLKRYDMMGKIFVGSKEIISGFCDSVRGKTLAGYAYLDKGIYKVDFRVAGGITKDLVVSKEHILSSPFSMTITPPSSDSPLPAHKVLFLVKQ